VIFLGNKSKLIQLLQLAKKDAPELHGQAARPQEISHAI
jgi:hypothetical protein